MENYDQKIAFFLARASHSKLLYIVAEGAFRKILGFYLFQNSKKGGPKQRIDKIFDFFVKILEKIPDLPLVLIKKTSDFDYLASRIDGK